MQDNRLGEIPVARYIRCVHPMADATPHSSTKFTIDPTSGEQLQAIAINYIQIRVALRETKNNVD